MEFEKVSLMMVYKHPLNETAMVRREIVPTGNWRIDCIDGTCKLMIGYHGKTTYFRDVIRQGRFGITHKVVERYTIDIEKFVSEDFLEIHTVSPVFGK